MQYTTEEVCKKMANPIKRQLEEAEEGVQVFERPGKSDVGDEIVENMTMR